MSTRRQLLLSLGLILAAPATSAARTDDEILTRLAAARDQAAAIDPRFAAASVGHSTTPEHDAYAVRLPQGDKEWFFARLDAYDGEGGRTTRWTKLPEDGSHSTYRVVRGSTRLSLQIPLTLYRPQIARIFQRALDWCGRE